MPGKKVKDAVASFFGEEEDLDWFADEEDSDAFVRPTGDAGEKDLFSDEGPRGGETLAPAAPDAPSASEPPAAPVEAQPPGVEPAPAADPGADARTTAMPEDEPPPEAVVTETDADDEPAPEPSPLRKAKSFPPDISKSPTPPPSFAPPSFAGRASLVPREASADEVAPSSVPHSERSVLPTPPELWREAVDRLSASNVPADRGDEARIRALRLRDPESARAVLARAGDGPVAAWLRVQIDPESVEALVGLADHREGAERADLLRAAASLDPSDDTLLSRAVEADPTDVSAHLLRLARGRGSDAEREVLEGLAEAIGGPYRVLHDVRRAQLARARGDAEAALAALDAAHAADPTHPGVASLWEAMGVAKGLAPDEALAGWAAWQQALRREADGDRAEADAAWARAVEVGGLDPLAAWWAARRGDADALADAVQKGISALGARVTPLLRFTGAIALAQAGRMTAALEMARVDAEAYPPCGMIVGPLASRVVPEGEALDAARALAEKGDGVAAVAVARALDAQGAPVEDRVAAWSRALALGQPVAARLDAVALAAGDTEAREAALRGRIEAEPEGARKSAWKLDLAMLLRGREGAGEEAASLLDEALGSVAEAAPELKASLALARGDLAEAGRILVAAGARGTDDLAVVRRLEGAMWLAESGSEGGSEALDAVLADLPDHAAAREALLDRTFPKRPDLLFEALRAEGSRESSGAAWVLAWLDGADMPVAEDVGGRAVLMALRAATATDSAEKARRWEAAGGGGIIRVAARAAALVDSAPGVAAIVLDAAHEDASPGLARLAWRAGRSDVALALVSRAEQVDEVTRDWLRLEAANTAEALQEVVRDLTLTPSQRWAVLMHPQADESVLGAQWRVLADDEGAPAPLRAAAHARLAVLSSGDEARAHWEAVLTHRPGSLDAFDHLRRDALEARDADRIRALYAAHRPDDVRGRAETLDLVGVPDVDGWRARVEADDAGAYDRVAFEVALLREEAWKDLFDRWSESLDATEGADRAVLEERRRWLLANRLADSDAAWDVYSRLHEEDPEDREVLENLARIAGARGDVDMALEHLRQLRATSNDPAVTARTYRRMAEVLESAGRDDEAHQAWLDALDASPDDTDALSGLRRLTERKERWDELHVVLKRQASLLSGEAKLDATRALARLCGGPLEDPARALETWEEVLREQPEDHEALMAVLELSEASGDDDEIVRVGRRLVLLTEGDERRAMRARVAGRCEDAGRVDTALELYEGGLTDSPPDAAAAEALERIARQRGDYERIVRARVARAAAAADDAEAAIHLVEAARVQLAQRFDREAAHHLFAQALVKDPMQPDALRFEATWLFDAARYDEALAVHERLAPLLESEDLDDPDLRVEVTTFYFRFGQMLSRRGDGERALRRWNRALELNPSHLPTLQAVGPIAAEGGDWRKVREVYGRLLQLTGGQGEPTEVAQIYAMLGRADLHDGDKAKARKRLQRALEIRPGFVPALRGMARVHVLAGEVNPALNLYNEVISSASPDEDEEAIVEAYLVKGRLLDQSLQRPDKAREHYAGCLSYLPGEPRALVRMMELALREGAWEEVARHAQEALNAQTEGPLRAATWLGLAIARFAEEDDAGAEDAMAKAIKADASLSDVSFRHVEEARAALIERLPE